MSDLMLHGVLRMQPELWHDDPPIDVAQRHGRYVQASDRIKADEQTIERLLTVIGSLRKAKGRYHSEQAYKALMAAVAEVEAKL